MVTRDETRDSVTEAGLFRDYLEESGDFGVFWSLLSAELHIHVRCLAMDVDITTVRLIPYFPRRYIFELACQRRRFEVNQHPVAEVMHVLLKSGQSASREEAVKEMKDCRSTVHPWCRSTVTPEYGPTIVDGYAIYAILVFYSIVLSYERREELLRSPPGTPSESSWNSFGFIIAFIYSIHL
ncbi:hypothetical protein F2Q70_00043291 [Brassica cretica]|uniref:Uncharacterized protein n=2 Tax=Brassica cretica TaxID=69181 RepID=A0A8S9KI60_BRACR|nr:hypothetical protein F2Q70_00043291 [Brassica cretica]KAF2606610.1 hypothetical protein F2Q68_00044196 [Brassica cretica]KAF3520127.1 hypothetical protein DY000_02060246 [Brassica cretica]